MTYSGTILITPPVERLLTVLRVEYEDNGGWPVRVRRLSELAGYRTPSIVHRHLLRLAEAELAERGPSDKDGWRPVGAA